MGKGLKPNYEAGGDTGFFNYIINFHFLKTLMFLQYEKSDKLPTLC